MGNVIPISLGMVKAFILQGDRPVLVDTGMHGKTGLLLAGLSRNGVKPEEVGLLFITHAHADHYGSLTEVKTAVPAPVAVHRLDAESLRVGTGVEPDVLLEDEFDLRQYGVAGKLLWTPGHTRGSMSVMLESDEAILADLVLPRFMAFGPPAIAFWATSREDSLASIRKVLDYKPSIILTSHGGPFRPEALARLVR